MLTFVQMCLFVSLLQLDPAQAGCVILLSDMFSSVSQ